VAADQQLRRTSSTNGARPSPSALAGATVSKRSTPLALVGVAAVVIGALVFLGLYAGLDARQSVLVATRAVAPGQVITAEDLSVADISVPDGATVVPCCAAQPALEGGSAQPSVPSDR
jgi:flagella basal body P-ring formation protein FlgA